MVGFVTLAGLALGLVSVVVLLPAYARMAYARYERDCEKAAVAELTATAAANERLLAALPNNPVLTKRLALSQGRLVPDNEVIVASPSATGAPPDVVTPVRLPRPSPPNGVLLAAAAKLQNPPTRRGLLLLAAGTLLVAVFLFAPPDRDERK